MSHASPQLASAFRDLGDALDDFKRSSVPTAKARLAQFGHSLDAEPMHGFLAASLPSVDLDEWLTAASRLAGSALGSGGLPWPRDRPASVAMRVAYLRGIASDRLNLFNVLIEHFREGKSPDVTRAILRFANDFLDPLVRDIKRLTEDRILPPALTDLIRGLPASGDQTFDSMVRAAVESFRDPAPAARAQAVEKLWDAWERMKTLDDGSDKKASVKLLLDRGSSEPAFRAMLEVEASALTAIGNSFHIRHFETNKVSIGRPEQLDYLFHRMLGLINLLLNSGARS
jgi:hypothetical protein